MFWLYILKCSDGSFYTGHTDDLEKRLGQHNNGDFTTCYTFKRRPLQLVFSEYFLTREEALEMELQVKGWSRKKKLALIDRDFDMIRQLSKKHWVKPENSEE